MEHTQEAPTFNCPVDATLSVIGGKWKALILWHLNHEKRRFGELRRAIPGASEKVLIQQLRQLERSGVVSRHVIETVPPQVTYALTQHGRDLKLAIGPICDWGIEYAQRTGAKILILDEAPAG